MKKILCTLISLLGLAGISSCIAGTDSGKVTEEKRNVSDFTSIRIESVGNVYFTQSDTYSLRLKGNEKLVNETTTEVKDGTLTIDTKTKKLKMRGRSRLDIYISAPDLKKVKFDGVGNFKCSSRMNVSDIKFDIDGVGNVDIRGLNCQNLSLNVDGVGNAKVNVQCRSLKADLGGVGNVTLSGKAESANIHKGGIGNVRTSNLHVGK